METIDDIIDKIAEATGEDKKDIREKINEKRKELAGIISEEGAAYIVAKDSGIELIKKKNFNIKIEHIVSGMKNINIRAVIGSIGDVREFRTKKGEGRVCHMVVGDETGSSRLVLWNDQVDKIKEMKRGDAISIVNAYVKDNLGRPEIMLGKYAKIEKTDEREGLPDPEKVDSMVSKKSAVSRNYFPRTLSELREGEPARIRACIVNIFESSPFFMTCPECGIKVKDKCETHSKAEPNLVISGIIDDGSGNIRAVFFRESAEKLIGMKTKEAWEMFEKGRDIEKILGRIELGKDMVFNGFAKRNKLFDRLEFIANSVNEVDIAEETKALLKQMSQ